VTDVPGESAWVDKTVLSRLIEDIGPEIVGRTIDLFLEQAPARLTAVRDGLRRADLGTTAEALHSIKSSAAMLGAAGLSEVAGRGELLAREGRLAETNELLEGFETAFRETTTLLRLRRRRLAGGR